MPIYEYVCESCKKHYEAIVLSSDTQVKCPKCGSGKKTMQLSVFAKPASSNGSVKSESPAPRCMGNPNACGCH